MADDVGWKAVPVVDGWFGIHRPSLPNVAQLDFADGLRKDFPVYHRSVFHAGRSIETEVDFAH